MCGIAGIVHSTGQKIDLDALSRMSEGILRRGPDGNGTFIDPSGSAAITHSRLAIIDLSPAGAQPMRIGDLVISFNGEIYNHAELRRGLEQNGRTFRSHSDTEVLLQLYEAQGERMLPRLRGMFAFVIWNERTRTLFGARDMYGVKPFYYLNHEGTFAFASLVDALVRSGLSRKQIDVASAAGFLLTGSVPEPGTHIEDIRALPAGSYFTLGSSGDLEIHSWASPASILSGSSPIESENTPEPVRAALRENMSLHLVSDVPIVAFLSAGIDSNSMVAMAREVADIDLNSLTLAFDELAGTDLDEAPLAEKTARSLGIRHRTIRLTRSDFQNEIATFLERMDQPTIDGANTYMISRVAAAEGFKVALSGLGADELLGGYPSFKNLPRFVRATRPLAPLLSMTRGLRAAGVKMSKNPRTRKLLATPAIGGSWSRSYIVQRQLFLEEEIETILSRDVARSALRRLGYDSVVEKAITPDPGGPFQRVSALESSLYMKNQLLRDADWASMAHSLEVRVPFAEATLLRKLAPYLHGSNSKKRWLPDSTHQSIADEIKSRRKTGFVVPIWSWMPPELGIRSVRGWALHVFDQKFPGLRTGLR